MYIYIHAKKAADPLSFSGKRLMLSSDENGLIRTIGGTSRNGNNRTIVIDCHRSILLVLSTPVSFPPSTVLQRTIAATTEGTGNMKKLVFLSVQEYEFFITSKSHLVGGTPPKIPCRVWPRLQQEVQFVTSDLLLLIIFRK